MHLAEDKAILIKTAYGYYQRGDWDRAIEEYHKLADMDPSDLNVLNILADIYAKRGDIAEAMRQYDVVAQGYDQRDQVDKVLQVYRRMLRLAPDRADLQEAVRNLAHRYLDRAAQWESQDPQKALEIYQAILRAEPQRMEAAIRMSKLLMKTGEKFRAIEQLMRLADELDPETQTGRLVEVLRLVVEWDPAHIEARERLAQLHHKAGDPSAAAKEYQTLTEIYLSKNDFPRAEATAQKALDLGDQRAYYHLGVVHFHQERYSEAREAFEKFLESAADHVGALKYLALTCLRLEDVGGTVAVYRRILDVYLAENLLEEAKEVRRVILEMDPQNEIASLNLGDEPSEAVEQAQPQAEKTPDEEERFREEAFRQAQEYTSKGLYDQAVDLYLEMLKRWPKDPGIRTALQNVYALMVRAQEPVEKGPDPKALKENLERELREQMIREMQEQRRLLEEEKQKLSQARVSEMEALKRSYEEERQRLLLEMEARLKEQMDRNRVAEEMRERLLSELKEEQKKIFEERDKLEQNYRLEKQSLEEEIRRKVEQEVREKLEREFRERLQREEQEKERRKRLEEELRRQQEEEERQREEWRRKEEEHRRQQARVEQEIAERMERLRLEKEKEKAQAQPPAKLQAPAPEPSGEEKPSFSEEENLEADVDVEDPFMRQTLADIYAKQGLYLEALKIYEKILTEQPDNEEVRAKLKELLKQKGI